MKEESSELSFFLYLDIVSSRGYSKHQRFWRGTIVDKKKQSNEERAEATTGYAPEFEGLDNPLKEALWMSLDEISYPGN